MGESQNHAEENFPDKKEYIVHDYIYIKLGKYISILNKRSVVILGTKCGDWSGRGIRVSLRVMEMLFFLSMVQIA